VPQEPVLLDGPAVACALGIKPELIRQWARRGKLTRRGADDHGRTLYDLAEAYRVQAEMRRERPPSSPSGNASGTVSEDSHKPPIIDIM
jgi:hypothetical protein